MLVTMKIVFSVCWTYHEHLFVLQVQLLNVMNPALHWIFKVYAQVDG